jgi:hypothetical protein
MRFLIVRVPDFCGADEKIKRIINIFIIQTLDLHIFDLLHSLLLMTRKLQFILITPQDLRFASTMTQLRQNVVEVDNLVTSTVAHHHEHRTLICLVTVLQQSLNTTVYLLLHC